MCGGGGGGDGGAAAREAQRQANITAGYNQIQRIFDGYQQGVGKATTYDPNASYYNTDGSAWGPSSADLTNYIEDSYARALGIDRQAMINRPHAINSPSGLSAYNAALAQAEAKYRTGGITGAQSAGAPTRMTTDAARAALANTAIGSGSLFTGSQHTGGFTDDFYNDRAQSYVDYATPQLERQYADAQKQLEFALSRNGRLDSSVAGEQRAQLLEDYNKQRTAIADRGLQYANQARNNVEGSRADLISLNSNMANPNQIAIEAQNRLAGLKAAQAYDPLAPLFINVGDALGTQAELERRSTAKYNSGLFTPSAVSGGEGSGKTLR